MNLVYHLATIHVVSFGQSVCTNNEQRLVGKPMSSVIELLFLSLTVRLWYSHVCAEKGR